MSRLQNVRFDYSTLPSDLATNAIQIAARIKARMVGGYIATGHDLIDMKDRLGHGRFGAWLAAEFGLSARSAERYMAAARFGIANPDTVSELLPATMQALAAPLLSNEARETCMARVRAGQCLYPSDVASVVHTARDIARRREEDERKLPRAKKAREQAAADLEAKHRQEDQEYATAERRRIVLAALIVECLGERRREAFDLVQSLQNWFFEDHFKAALYARVASDNGGEA
jgi:hypothetical protein